MVASVPPHSISPHTSKGANIIFQLKPASSGTPSPPALLIFSCKPTENNAKGVKVEPRLSVIKKKTGGNSGNRPKTIAVSNAIKAGNVIKRSPTALHFNCCPEYKAVITAPITANIKKEPN